MVNILVCGLGSIGKRHARLIKECFPDYSLYALRTGKGQEKNDLGIPEFYSWEALNHLKFDVALITAPTFLHIDYAIECANREMNLFIEKSIDCKTDRLDQLLSLVEEKGLTTYVAYPLRFHPVVKKLKEVLKGQKILHSRIICASYLPDWRPGQDHKKCFSSMRDMGGGVVLELSHEIDLVSYLFGEINSVKGYYDRVSDITVDSEDFADILIDHKSGISSIHLNYFSRKTQRVIEVDTDKFYVKADLIGNSLSLDGENEKWTKEYSFATDDMFASQLRYYFKNIDNPRMDNNIFEANRLFRKMIMFKNRPSIFQ